ncbi:MAG: NifU family protein [Actinomycetota bacterium]
MRADVGRDSVVTISDEARQKIVMFRSGQSEAQDLALWFEVSGVSGLEYTHDLYLHPVDEAAPGDVVQHHDDFTLVVPEASVDKVRGARIKLEGDLVVGHLSVENPNSPSPAVGAGAGGDLSAVGAGAGGDLSGDVPQRVHQVLEEHINPAIAAHGGRADLVAVEEGTAYLRLSGGCQGCGMASVTLGQGIEVAIKQAVPEIVKVVDVTDHASGTNPYFESSKK